VVFFVRRSPTVAGSLDRFVISSSAWNVGISPECPMPKEIPFPVSSPPRSSGRAGAVDGTELTGVRRSINGGPVVMADDEVHILPCSTVMRLVSSLF